MGMNIYVGNIPFSADENEVRELFAQYGAVHRVSLISDRETGRFRGFGFVEMDDADGAAAVDALNGYQMGGRALKVNEAKPREDRGDRRASGGGQRRW